MVVRCPLCKQQHLFDYKVTAKEHGPIESLALMPEHAAISACNCWDSTGSHHGDVWRVTVEVIEKISGDVFVFEVVADDVKQWRVE